MRRPDNLQEGVAITRPCHVNSCDHSPSRQVLGPVIVAIHIQLWSHSRGGLVIAVMQAKSVASGAGFCWGYMSGMWNSG